MEDSPEMALLIEKFKADIEAESADRRLVCAEFVETVRQKFGLPEMLTVYEMSEEMHTRTDPVEELRAMVGDDKVVVIPCCFSIGAA